MIIDAHAHWLPDEIISNAHFFHKGWGDIEAQVRMMEKAGIDKAVLSYPSSDAHLKLEGPKEVARIFNDNLAKILKRYPDKFIAAAVLPFGDSKGMLDELKRAIDLGFRGISLASSYDGIYLDDARFLPIYDYAQGRDIPVFVHAQIVNPIGYGRVQDPLLTPVIEYVFDTTMCAGKLLMSGVLRDYKVKFIFAYFAGVTLHLANRFDATYAMLRGIDFVKDLKGSPTDFLKNIYVDTSGDKSRANFISALGVLGPSHILWGSDWPAKQDIGAGMDAIRALDISQSDKDGILGGNLARLLAL